MIKKLAVLFGTALFVIACGGVIERKFQILVDYHARYDDRDPPTCRYYSSKLAQLYAELSRANEPEIKKMLQDDINDLEHKFGQECLEEAQ